MQVVAQWKNNSSGQSKFLIEFKNTINRLILWADFFILFMLLKSAPPKILCILGQLEADRLLHDSQTLRFGRRRK